MIQKDFLQTYTTVIHFISEGIVLSKFIICLINVICVCLRIVVSNTYCVLFLFVSCVLCFSGLSIFDCPFGILKRLFKSQYLEDAHEQTTLE